MSRRENTERKLLNALEEQINATGMVGVGVNAVAKRAGVSKELIYRYFDGMPGLLLAWMQEQDFWTARAG
ncbi:TetR/AcrR family transcriptional regulator [Advenella kashmirensis]|uniref:TetR/AcrR family transcriptional regulator n=1 Tax=Advenella kashmirensis TaxID=310575 RepID=UPI0026C5E124|nr:helix-turn-helix domain-containing protein [Advenella kashmirensis]